MGSAVVAHHHSVRWGEVGHLLKDKEFPAKWPDMDIQSLELKSGSGYGGRFGSFSLNLPEL